MKYIIRETITHKQSGDEYKYKRECESDDLSQVRVEFDLFCDQEEHDLRAFPNAGFAMVCHLKYIAKDGEEYTMETYDYDPANS